MFLSLITLAVALSLSAIAAFYSIAGLAAIFAAAVIPIVVMGSVLEVAKLVVTVWLHEYWPRCRLLMKVYLSIAVVILMLITSMGIFGFLSKAHMDQGMVSGDVQAKIAIYDEKIKTAKENIDANRRALKQMDEAVDQIMGRSTTETGAERSVQIRRQQGPERKRLIAEIEAEQKKISALNEERAPIAAEVRKVEAEVGPIKYIAALIYGDNLEANLLEKAVRWVIILLVIVFDPLAVMMLLAATESLQWRKEDKNKQLIAEPFETEKEAEDFTEAVAQELFDDIDKQEQKIKTESKSPAWMFSDPGENPRDHYDYELSDPTISNEPEPDPGQPDFLKTVTVDEDDDSHDDSDQVKEAKRRWKADHPGETLKEQRRLVEAGILDRLPWEDYLNTSTENDNIPYGPEFPTPSKGMMFLNTSYQPTKLFKHNGEKWIEVDKNLSDRYVYNDSYIDYLISKISSGEYDPELLNDSERAQIEEKLRQGQI